MAHGEGREAVSWYWDREVWSDGPSTPTTDEPVRNEPQVTLFFSGEDPAVTRTAVDACRIEGWPAEVGRDGEFAVRVPKMRVVRLLRRMNRLGIRPARISIRSAEILPAQVEAIRQVLGTATIIDVVG